MTKRHVFSIALLYLKRQFSTTIIGLMKLILGLSLRILVAKKGLRLNQSDHFCLCLSSFHVPVSTENCDFILFYSMSK